MNVLKSPRRRTSKFQIIQNHPELFSAQQKRLPRHRGTAVFRREAVPSPGIRRGPRGQQHPADLGVAFARRAVQGGGVVQFAHRGRGAGVRPQDVSHGAVRAIDGRRVDVVATSEATGLPPSVVPQRRPQKKSSNEIFDTLQFKYV